MPPKKAEVSARIQTYLDQHDLQKFVQSMLTALCKKTPDEPMQFMVDYIHEQAEKKGLSLRSDSGIGMALHGESGASNESFSATSPGVSFAKSETMRRISMEMSAHPTSTREFVKQWTDMPAELDTRMSDEDLSETDVPISPLSGRQNKHVPGTSVHRLGLLRKGQVSLTAQMNMTAAAETILSWDYDALDVPDVTLIGHVLTVLDAFKLPEAFKMDRKVLQNYVSTIAVNYNSENAYHNFSHAFSLVQYLGIVLRHESVTGPGRLEQLDALTLLMASLVHDVGHPGVNNDFLIKSKHELAIRYNDISVLEAMHASRSFEILYMEDHDFLAPLTEEQQRKYRRILVDAVLKTDMKIHFDLIGKLQEFESLDVTKEADRDFFSSVVVHAADLLNPLLPFPLCQKWAYRVVTEFHNQAEAEKSAGMQFAPFMEHHPDNTLELSKLQIGFISFVVSPFWSAMVSHFPFFQDRLDQLASNKDAWTAIRDEEEKKAA